MGDEDYFDADSKSIIGEIKKQIENDLQNKHKKLCK